MFHRLIILVLTDFGTTPGHNTVEYLIRCHKSNWQAVNWFVKEKWNERLWIFLQWYILVVYSSINASNWLSLTFSKDQLQKFCNFYTSLDGLMSKTILLGNCVQLKIRNYSFLENVFTLNITRDFFHFCYVLNILAGNSKHWKAGFTVSIS